MAGKPRDGKRRGSKGPRRSSVAKNLSDVESAIERIGRGRIKRGPIPLGTVRARVAGRRGVRAIAREIAESGASIRELKTLTYSISITLPNGEKVRIDDLSPVEARETIPALGRVRNLDKLEREIEKQLWTRIHSLMEQRQIGTDPITGKRVRTTAAGIKRRLTEPLRVQIQVYANV